MFSGVADYKFQYKNKAFVEGTFLSASGLKVFNPEDFLYNQKK